MGDMRKDYVLERDVIVHPTTKKSTDSKKCPYCPGNESMTNPSLLSLVAKDGMLQRLQDGEDFFVTDWSVRVFESKEPAVFFWTVIPIIPEPPNRISRFGHTFECFCPFKSFCWPVQRIKPMHKHYTFT